jgi:hypothetical protein
MQRYEIVRGGVEVAPIVFRRGPTTATNQENVIQDWDSLLYSLWLKEMALNPGFYSDVKGGS